MRYTTFSRTVRNKTQSGKSESRGRRCGNIVAGRVRTRTLTSKQRKHTGHAAAARAKDETDMEESSKGRSKNIIFLISFYVAQRFVTATK